MIYVLFCYVKLRSPLLSFVFLITNVTGATKLKLNRKRNYIIIRFQGITSGMTLQTKRMLRQKFSSEEQALLLLSELEGLLMVSPLFK